MSLDLPTFPTIPLKKSCQNILFTIILFDFVSSRCIITEEIVC